MFYLMLLVGPLIALTGFYSQIQTALGAAERVFALLDQPIDADDVNPDLPAMPPVQGHIAFNNVTFAYQYRPSDAEDLPTGEEVLERRPVLHDLSFSVAPGQVVALVGPSGAGKSTVLNLLLRLYAIDGGSITVDGIDTSTVQARSLRQQMAIVLQEPVLFGGTIAENIRYGKLDAGEEEIRAAAAAANALSFIDPLPEGLNSVVGERGVQLSVGQRQRIAIARALLRDPRILLLDEATASLDNESEAVVQEALNRLMQGRTTIVVAHRLTTVERADRILVLDGGRIVEQGTHSELLAQDGLYARLYNRDFADLNEPEGPVPQGGPVPTTDSSNVATLAREG